LFAPVPGVVRFETAHAQMLNRLNDKNVPDGFREDIPKIHRKQQGGIPVDIDKSRAHEVMASDCAAFDDPEGKSAMGC
jgi:hypothetical protein